AEFRVQHSFHVERLARQIHQCHVGRARFGPDVSGDSLGLLLHHTLEFDARLVNRLRIVRFEKREHLLAWKLGVDRQHAVGKLYDRIDAARTLATRRRLQVVHMTRQKILKQPLQTLLAESSPQMGHLEQIVQVVDRRPDHAEIFQLLLRFIEMILNFFELRKTVLNVLIQLYLHIVRNRRQLFADVRADPLDALPGLRRQRRDLQLERVRLLLASRREMLLQRGVEVQESFGQTIGGRKAEIALRLLKPSGKVGARLRQFLVETASDRIEALVQTREGIICPERAQFADYN